MGLYGNPYCHLKNDYNGRRSLLAHFFRFDEDTTIRAGIASNRMRMCSHIKDQVSLDKYHVGFLNSTKFEAR